MDRDILRAGKIGLAVIISLVIICFILFLVNSFSVAEAELQDMDTGTAFDSYSTAQALLGRAQEAFEKGDVDTAKKLYQRIIADYPPTSCAMQAQSEIAIINIKTHNSASADSAVQQLLEDYSGEPDISRYIRIVSTAYMEDNQPDKVKQLCQFCLSRWPGNKEAILLQRNLAIAYVKAGEYVQAETATDLLLQDYPADTELPKGIRRIAEAYYKSEQYFKAVDLYQTLISSWPNHAEVIKAYKYLPLIYIRLGEYEQADTSISNLLSCCSTSEEVGTFLRKFAFAYYKAEKYDKARSLCQEAIYRWPNHEDAILTKRDLVIDLIRIKEYGAAEAVTDELIRDYPDHAEICKCICKIASCFGSNKPETTKELCQLALTNWPEHSEKVNTQWLLACSLIQLEEFEEAEDIISPLLANYSDDPKTGDYIRKIASGYFNAGMYEKASSLCQEALYVWPNIEEAIFIKTDFVINLIRLSEYEQARMLTDELIADYFDHPELGNCISKIASYYFAPKMPGTTKELCQAVLTNWPEHSEKVKTHWLLACSLVKLKEFEEAEDVISLLLTNYYDDPNIGDYIRKIAFYYLYYNQFDSAVELYQLVIQNWPETNEIALAHAGLAAAYLKLGDLYSADAASTILLLDYSRDEQYYEAIDWLADQYFRSGNRANAVELYQYVLSCSPDEENQLVANDTAVLSAVDAEYDVYTESAIQLSDAFVELSRMPLSQSPSAGEELEAYAGLAKALVHSEDGTSENDFLSPEITNVNDIIELMLNKYNGQARLDYWIFEVGEEYFKTAEALRSQRKKREASLYYQKAMDIWEQKIIDSMSGCNSETDAYLFTGLCYERLNKYQKAVSYYQKVIQSWPDYQYIDAASCYLGVCLKKMFNRGIIEGEVSALEIEQAYLAVVDNYPNSRYWGSVCYKLASFYYQNQRWSDAICYYKMVRSRKYFPLVQYRLGECHENIGDYENAKYYYTEFLKNKTKGTKHDKATRRLEYLVNE